jgi:ubiquinone/menaquinone biosynthesis C-methylase UbiE
MMTDFELLIDFHQNAERQGPGSNTDTLKALSFIDSNNKTFNIADIGCGAGSQTLTLAKHINGKITAIDLFPQFLEKLNEKAIESGLDHKISTLAKSMDNLTFAKDSFDIIWAEGSIYIIGFEKGIKKWKEFLKPGGYIAVSEITWLTNERPEEIENHWNQEYPEIDTASAKIKILEENGFSLTGYFVLPPESWLNNYYKPMEERFEKFLEKHNYSDVAKSIVDAEQDEIYKYNKYKEYYSYGFYIARKT